MLSRRTFLATAAAATACHRARPSRPNILFVIADDMSWPHAGAYGDPLARTPNFDRVAREGVLFTRSYCNSPSCTPSRTSVLSGRPIWRNGEGGVLYGTLDPALPLFTDLLEDAGYHTGFTGKGWAPGDWRAAGRTRHPNGREYNSRRHASTVRPGIDQRDYAANFADFLAQRPNDKPFLFWFGCTEPHRVYDKGAGARMGRRIDDVRVPVYWPDHAEVRSDILDYHAEVDWFDQQLGNVLGVLERANQAANTFVVVTSDNGMPFPRAKVNLYDPGIHMPLAIRWPARFGGGRTIADFVSHSDFAPSILAAAGVEAPPGINGSSLLPLLDSGRSGQIDPARDRAYSALERHTFCRPDGATYPIRSLRTARHHYIRNFAPDRWPTGGPDFVSSNKTFHGDVDACPLKEFMTEPANRARFGAQYEQCFGKRPAEELYDVTADPDEVRNLVGDTGHAEALATLRADLEAHLRSTGDPRIEGRDPWQAYAYRQTTGFGASFNSALPEAQRRDARERPTHKPE